MDWLEPGADDADVAAAEENVAVTGRSGDIFAAFTTATDRHNAERADGGDKDDTNERDDGAHGSDENGVEG